MGSPSLASQATHGTVVVAVVLVLVRVLVWVWYFASLAVRELRLGRDVLVRAIRVEGEY